MKRGLPRGYIALVYLLLYIPIGVLVVYSFNANRSAYTWGGFSLRWYESLLANSNLMNAAKNSLLLAACTATLTTIIGGLLAIALVRYRFRGKALIGGMLFVVMMSPEIVMAISLLALFILLGMQLGFVSLLLAHITFCLPFVVVTVSARLAGFDPRLPEAARDLGASEWRMTRTVLLPLAWPALLAGWLLGFTLSLDDVVVSTFMTGPAFDVLPLRIYSMVRIGLSPEVNALGTLLLLLSLLTLTLSYVVVTRRSP